MNYYYTVEKFIRKHFFGKAVNFTSLTYLEGDRKGRNLVIMAKTVSYASGAARAAAWTSQCPIFTHCQGSSITVFI